jgi:two-component system LytT family sensor kinase
MTLTITEKIPRKLSFWSLQTAGWSYVILQDYLRLSPDERHNFIIILFIILVSLLGLLLTSLLRLYYHKFYNRNNSILKIFAVSALCSIVFMFVWQTLRDILAQALSVDLSVSVFKLLDHSVSFSRFIGYSTYMLWPPFLWSMLYFGIKFWLDLISEKERSDRAIILAKDAQLQMLRYQINPHFLFNTLNSIQALMYKNVEQADNMLTQFSEFLRYTLKHNDQTFIPLHEELEITSKYLSIEKIRFEERLEYKIEVEEKVKNTEILCFLMQPFVENALKHGMNNKLNSLNLLINVYSKGTTLCINIDNSGWWKNKNYGQQLGISNVKKRLENAYSDNHRFKIIEEDNWIKVRIEINNHLA